MRLIDADKLIEDLEYDVELDARELDDIDLLLGRDRELVQFDKDCKQNAVDLLKKAPPIDAEPVRYGRWIGPGLKYKSEIECTVCGEIFNIVSNETKRFNYCPHCGAKMDGEWIK